MPVFAAKGTRDFLPAQMRQRLAVIQKIRDVYASFGFDPIETPAMERIETLMGKYGEEGDRLIFKILERGEGGREGKADLALRYDLTVPLARVMAMNQGLPLPFKRYQIAPVWRADRPQKGRFREFYQCDADIVGTNSVMAEAECIAMANVALEALGFTKFKIHINHRKYLQHMVSVSGLQDRANEIFVALDKLDKIGPDEVKEELRDIGVSARALEYLWSMMTGFGLDVSFTHMLPGFSMRGDEDGSIGLGQLRALRDFAVSLGVPSDRIVWEPSLARGIGYYTGSIYEIKLTEGGVGTVAAGGRYDGLIGMFSGKPVPAVGISLGLERLLVVMEEQGLNIGRAASASVLVSVYSEEDQAVSLVLAAELRSHRVPTELWLGKAGDPNRALKYATQRGIPFVALVDPVSIAAGKIKIQVMATGERVVVPRGELPGFVSIN